MPIFPPTCLLSELENIEECVEAAISMTAVGNIAGVSTIEIAAVGVIGILLVIVKHSRRCPGRRCKRIPTKILLHIRLLTTESSQPFGLFLQDRSRVLVQMLNAKVSMFNAEFAWRRRSIAKKVISKDLASLDVCNLLRGLVNLLSAADSSRKLLAVLALRLHQSQWLASTCTFGRV